jgi:hypothetical protein
MLHAQRKRIVGRERNLAGDELIQQDAERVDVRRGLSRLSLEALRGHIGWRSIHFAGGGQRGWRFVNCQSAPVKQVHDAEIGQIYISPFIDEYVARLYITMDHPSPVGIINRARKLVQIVRCLIQGHPSLDS